MVELRKRREAPSDGPQPPLKKTTSAAKAEPELGSDVAPTSAANGTSNGTKLTVGDSIELEGFGGEIETQDGEKTNLKKLVNESKAGVVLFTYPKASTPGCTTQVCLFRDQYTPLTATGYSIFGLSTDSPKSNTTFKTKQNLPYTLLCDPSAKLISAIGLKKAPKGTTRGVFVVSKAGKVEAAEPGGPQATVDVVSRLIRNTGVSTEENVGSVAQAENVKQDIETSEKEPQNAANSSKEDTDGSRAEVAAEVADTAQKLDGDVAG